jgi:hypothetical protein
MRRRNIQKNQLVTALFIVNLRRLSGIANIRQIDEIDPLTTRPSLTSKHGMMRFANISELPQLI